MAFKDNFLFGYITLLKTGMNWICLFFKAQLELLGPTSYMAKEGTIF